MTTPHPDEIFKDRADLGDQIRVYGVYQFLQDGTTEEHMPQDDPELMRAWERACWAYDDLHDAIDAIKNLCLTRKTP